MKLRIREFREKAGWTQEEAAARLGIHSVNWSKMETGAVPLKMDRLFDLAEMFSCRPEELIAVLPERIVEVRGTVQAGHWAEASEWEKEDRYTVAIADDDRYSRLELFALEVKGPSMNRVYPEGTTLIVSAVAENGEQLVFGKRYVVERRGPDGLYEMTVKLLTRDSDGRVWLVPESDDPRFASPIPLAGGEGEEIRLVGRVRKSIRDED